MAEHSKIEWTDHTFNPWIGCTKVSPGCDHCYAECSTPSRVMRVHWGPDAPRRRTSAANWRKPLAWNRDAGAFYAQHRRRQRVFCASLADVFDNGVPPQWRRDLFDLIESTPNLDWLLLTKRIGNVVRMLPTHDWAARPNVWLGITVVNQAEADRDVPKLLQLKAHRRFLSMEPLLGPVDLEAACERAGIDRGVTWTTSSDPDRMARAVRYGDASRLDWVIIGGESGPGARPMHPDWARSLRDQCQDAGVPLFFKQWGEWAPGEIAGPEHGRVQAATSCAGKWLIDRVDNPQPDDHIDDEPDLFRIGKKAAGRLLDGREWNEVPQ